MWKLTLFATLCAVIKVNSYRTSGNCEGCRNIEYTRVKRGRYFSNPPVKFYNRPPNSLAIKGPFSYTPPPGYTSDNGPENTSYIRPYKVSKTPTSEGLEDEDINNIIKHLSKKDFNKLIRFASESERHSNLYKQPIDISNNEFNGLESKNNNVVNKDRQQDYETSIYINKPNTRPEEYKQNNFETYGKSNYITNNHQGLVDNNHLIKGQMYFKEQEDQQFSFLNTYIQKEINAKDPNKNVFTDSRTLQEEPLPRPSNLRNDDFEISFTNNIPKVLKPQTSYDIKNFADLPLMNYENSKLESVNSYNVPHYSVTSFNPQGSKLSLPSPSSSLMSLSPSLIHAPEVKSASAALAAKDQSDAHLKAIKIWTHKSQGTAYTLHDDGTLSLEGPSRPKIKFV